MSSLDPLLIIGTLATVVSTLAGIIFKLQGDRIKWLEGQIERWQKVAESNGAMAVESLAVTKQTKATLDKIGGEIRRARQSGSGRGLGV